MFMSNTLRGPIVALTAVMLLASAAYATNGDNLMAIGPIARAMGGVGIAAPQDAISAVFANPAAMCFGPYCPASEFNFAGTVFMPHPQAKVDAGGTSFKVDSDEKVYLIPALGISVPITKGPPFWRFGLAAYGASGLGVDYRDSRLDQPGFFDVGNGRRAPLIAGEFTELSILKMAPSIAFQPLDNLSFGAAFHVDYATLDLRHGSSAGYGFGAQFGMIYRVTDNLSIGLNYVTPQNVDHDNVTDFDGDGSLDTLKLESPHQVGLGVAYTMLAGKLLLEGDVKWLNWSAANGYSDFDWNDQWVFAFGVQYKPMSKLALRLGYNYGTNPVEEHNGWVGFRNANVQGHTLPKYYYETFRIIGFPAIVEHHATGGIGYDITDRVGVNLGYTHAFENRIRERGFNLVGQPTTLESKLSEDSLDFGLTWRF